MKLSMSVEETVDAKALEIYIENFLVPNLGNGQIVAMDNLSVHKSTRVQRLT
jgi:transposase